MTQSYIICSCLAVLAFCNADYLSDIPALKEMMNNQELKEDLASMLEPRLADTDPKDMYTVLKAIQSQEQPAESDTVDSGDVSKRPFCNGFTGCGRFGKRRLRLIRQRFPIKVLSSQVKKRPFCNGFFGCGNGKRSTETELMPENISEPQKKLFCNSMSGCSSAGKRYAAFIEHLRGSNNSN